MDYGSIVRAFKYFAYVLCNGKNSALFVSTDVVNVFRFPFMHDDIKSRSRVLNVHVRTCSKAIPVNRD